MEEKQMLEETIRRQRGLEVKRKEQTVGFVLAGSAQEK